MGSGGVQCLRSSSEWPEKKKLKCCSLLQLSRREQERGLSADGVQEASRDVCCLNRQSCLGRMLSHSPCSHRDVLQGSGQTLRCHKHQVQRGLMRLVIRGLHCNMLSPCFFWVFTLWLIIMMTIMMASPAIPALRAWMEYCSPARHCGAEQNQA